MYLLFPLSWKLTWMSKNIFKAGFSLACCSDGDLSIHIPAPLHEHVDSYHSSSQVCIEQHLGGEALTIKPAR